MTPRTASRTAVFVAGCRARASAKPEKLCDDPWAAALAGDEGFELAARYEVIYPPFELWIALRTAFIDDRLRRSIAPPWSIRQIVMLGAGLDTRAARLASPGVRFFEVDHPSSQADKLRRLSGLSGYPIDAATYVACDFEHQDFVVELERSGFALGEPALFIWEGVTPYLTEAAVRGTLSTIAGRCEPRSILLFDYLGKRMITGHVDADANRTRDFVGDLNEPFRWGTNDVLPVLYNEGFRRVRVTSFDEICLDRTGTYDRDRQFRFQSIAIASRAASELP